MKFMGEACVELNCVVSYPVGTDIDFCSYAGFSLFGQIECDDIGIEIVVQKVAVNFEQPFIGTKNIIEGFETFSFLFKNRLDKIFKLGAVPERNIFLKIKMNGHSNFLKSKLQR